MSFEYRVASDVAEALQLLSAEKARVIAGGTDLVIDMKEGKYDAQVLVDVSGIEALKSVCLEGDTVCVGPCCTFAQLENDPIIRAYAPALARAASQVGSPQIRNVATLGGNVANAMPAADGAVALMGLGAKVVLESAEGTVTLALEDCYAGVGKSVIDPGKQIITQIRFPGQTALRKCVYQRFALRQSLALPVVAACVQIEKDESGLVKEARLVLAPAGKKPWREEELEGALVGKPYDVQALRSACTLAAEKAPFRDSPARCSAAYKHLLAKTLLLDCVDEAEKLFENEA